MKNLLLDAGSACLTLCAASAEATETLVLKDLRANVEIVPEDRADMTVVVETNGSSDPTPVVNTAGDSVTISRALTAAPPGGLRPLPSPSA